MVKNDKRLIGIKAIAEYLDTSERNIYRWEKELNLPLRRIASAKGRTVYANVEDLEEWLKHKKYSRFYGKKQTYNYVIMIPFMLFIIFLITILILIIMRGKSTSDMNPVIKSKDSLKPVNSIFEGNVLTIKSQNGNVIRSYVTRGDKFDFPWERYKCIDFLDIDNDGANEFVGRKYNMDENKYYLALFDNDGAKFWERDINNEQEFNGIKFRSEYFPLHIRFAHINEKSLFIVTHWRHRTRFVSLISSHDLEGKLINKYIHVGHLAILEIYDLDDDGSDEIIFTGINNLLNGEGVLGILPLSNFKGISPPYQVEPEYRSLTYRLQKYVAINPEKGNQNIYLRFKMTNHLKEYRKSHIIAVLDGIDSNLIHVLLAPWGLDFVPQSIGFEYAFDFKFNLLDIIPDAYLVMYYPMLCERRRINITIEELTDIYKKVVLRWDNGKWVKIGN